MKSTSASLISLAIVWGVASAVGFVAMAMLMMLGDWTLLQALFAAAAVFFVLGSVLSLMFLAPLPGPQKPGTAGWAARGAAPKAHGKPVHAAPAAAPAPAKAPAAAAAPAPAAPASAEGARPAGLSAARAGGADDLKRIKGIGPKLEQLCNSLGFYHFDQIAAWTPAEVAWVDDNLEGFKGRVTRDNWVEQAKLLAAGGQTEFSRKVDKGDVY
ncbi:NADH:ubiquinone oxidoreductase [Roseicyclus persicicus]|uniref:NADH:ubiquinone oxidoreductase n=1 Tax=Roseicyclus persicicus TaxID=2650661 RepID=A0A7X6JYD0_9RHOB|nr:NADH:ubiquinone oxidoreductase [Roseibacterium persicicum]NKX44339.1 NADH:ubiquinone oxidoreductase [Roseibacterium persicicum]